MLGRVLKNEKQARSALEKIKEAGYGGIELCSFMTKPTPLAVRLLTSIAGMPCGSCGHLDWAAMTKEFSLKVVSLHTDLGSLEKNVDSCAEEALRYGTKYVVITGMYGFDYTNYNAVTNLASRLNTVGKALLERGLRLLYHNHNSELVFTNSGTRAYDILIEKTDEKYVNFEFDSYWFAEGGADTIYWMRRLGKRMRLWHVNDRGVRQRGKSMTPILKSDSMEAGTGNMPLEKLFEIAKEAGCEAAVLETHRNWINGSPIDSLTLSAKFINQMSK